MEVSDEIKEMRARFLSSAASFVGRTGWLDLDVGEVAAASDISVDEVKLLFPAGALDMADSFLALGDERLRDEIGEAELPTSVREKIGHLIWLRLAVDGDRERKEVLRRTRSFFMLPPYAPRGLVCLSRTSDAIWRLAGDKSTDFSYYTKRFTLSGIFAEALTVFLSPLGSEEDRVKSFIAWRINHLMSLARLFGRLRG